MDELRKLLETQKDNDKIYKSLEKNEPLYNSNNNINEINKAKEWNTLVKNIPEVSLNYLSSNNNNKRFPRTDLDFKMNNTLNRVNINDNDNDNLNDINITSIKDRKMQKYNRDNDYDNNNNQNYNKKYHKKKKEINNLKHEIDRVKDEINILIFQMTFYQFMIKIIVLIIIIIIILMI